MEGKEIESIIKSAKAVIETLEKAERLNDLLTHARFHLLMNVYSTLHMGLINPVGMIATLREEGLLELAIDLCDLNKSSRSLLGNNPVNTFQIDEIGLPKDFGSLIDYLRDYKDGK
jgi:hypothetical protein